MYKNLIVSLVVFTIIGFNQLRAENVFKPNPQVIESLRKEIIMQYRELIDGSPEKYRLLFKFQVREEVQKSYFSERHVEDMQIKVTVEETRRKNKDVYKVVSYSPSATKTIYSNKHDFTAVYSDLNRFDVRLEVFYMDSEILLKQVNKGQTGTGTMTIKPDYTILDERFAPLALAAFPFDTEKSFDFWLFYYGDYKLYQVSVKQVESEKIKVPLGEFETYKLLLSPKGIIYPLFSKNYLWYRKKSPHLLLRAEKNKAWYYKAVWELAYIGVERKEDLPDEVVTSIVE